MGLRLVCSKDQHKETNPHLLTVIKLEYIVSCKLRC